MLQDKCLSHMDLVHLLTNSHFCAPWKLLQGCLEAILCEDTMDNDCTLFFIPLVIVINGEQCHLLLWLILPELCQSFCSIRMGQGLGAMFTMVLLMLLIPWPRSLYVSLVTECWSWHGYHCVGTSSSSYTFLSFSVPLGTPDVDALIWR